jgi:hypothetical protein
MISFGLDEGWGVAIGSEAFIGDIQQMHRSVANKRKHVEDVSFRRLRSFRSVDEVKKAVETVLEAPAACWMKRKAGALERGFYAWALQRYAGLTQRDAAGYLGVGTARQYAFPSSDSLRAKPVGRGRKSWIYF